jgi:hypothetical protein
MFNKEPGLFFRSQTRKFKEIHLKLYNKIIFLATEV